MLFALVLIVLAAGWRIVALHIPALANFAPMMALTFWGAVYFRDKRMWLVPFVALTLSDLYLDPPHPSGYHQGWYWPRVAGGPGGFSLALPPRAFIPPHKKLLGPLGGAPPR